MNVTVLIVYPAAVSTVTESSGREVWDIDASPTPWVKVGEETFDVPGSVLENIDIDPPTWAAELVYCRWNNGSGEESEAFRAAERRSLSVGDMVVIPAMEITLRCGRIGWDVVDAPVADTIADEGDDTMDIDYGRGRRAAVA